jgi:TP901 family phage tail tape measure protein
MGAARISALALGAALSAAAIAGFRSARGLDAALAEASTLLEGTTAEMSLMRKEARAMAAEFGGGTTAQVEAFYQAISSGAGSVEEASMLLHTANLLAKGGVTDITTSVDILTTAVNAYAGSGLTAAQSSDILFTGVKFGKTTVEELASSLGRAAPLAGKLGVGFDELVAATAALTKGGVSTAEAVTGVRGVLSAVLKPTSEAATAAEALGLEFNAAALESKGLVGFLQDVIAKTGGSSEALAELFGGMEGLSGVLGLATNNGAAFNEAMAEMQSSLGATQEAADKVSGSLSDRLDVSLGKIGIAFQTLGGLLLQIVVPALEFVVDNFDLLVIAITAVAFTQIPALIATMATAATGMGILSVATGAFTAAINLARIATIALGGPIGIIWGLIGAAGAAWLVFKDNAGEAETGMYDAAAASRVLNVALGDFYYTAAPSAGKSAIDLANDNYKLADSALAAAEATLAQMEALRAASTAASAGMGGMSQFISTTTTPEQMEAAAAAVRSAKSALDEAAASRNMAARAVTGAMSEQMMETLDVTRSLTVEVESTTSAVGGLGAALADLEVKDPTEVKDLWIWLAARKQFPRRSVLWLWKLRKNCLTYWSFSAWLRP